MCHPAQFPATNLAVMLGSWELGTLVTADFGARMMDGGKTLVLIGVCSILWAYPTSSKLILIVHIGERLANVLARRRGVNVAL